MFVFLDETGADRHHLVRKYGYSLCNVPLKHKILLARGERVFGLVFMSTNGLLDVSITKGATMEIPSEFVQPHRLPQLLPFDRQNTHSVVVMDNCAVHHIQENSGHDRTSGGNRHFLPP